MQGHPPAISEFSQQALLFLSFTEIRSNLGHMSDIEQEAPDPRFASFVYFQAQNGGLFLGRIPHPATGETSVNLRAARSVLDSLEMLSDKSKGNLNKAEEKLLAYALENLRKLFDEVEADHDDSNDA
jgi:hypothetical protein